MNRIRERLAALGQRASDAFARLDRRLAGIPRLLLRTLDGYNAHDGVFVSAAMAYYFFFALFPLVLALIALGSLYLDTERAKQAAINLVSQALPVFEDAIARNIDLVLAQRGPITILATLGLIYSASGLFGVLLAVVNRAWNCPRGRSSLIQRLLAIGLVLALALFLFLSLFLTTAFEAAGMSLARGLGLGAQEMNTLFNVTSMLISFAITSALFLTLYWKLPATRVRFADAWPAAVAAGVTWVAARSFFAWYLSVFTQYALVYGAFATIIGFLTWLYLTGYIIQLGAELSVQIAARRGRGPGFCNP